MSDVAIRMEHVYKKFRKGDVYNSLRDLLPALTGRMFRQEELSEGDKREFWAVQGLSFEVMEEFIDTPVKRYSSGMYARLGFSVAAHVDPDVLIVDEVLSVGDYAFQQKCIERMKEVLHGGAAVLFVSHNLKVVSEFCDRCLLLEKGQTGMTGCPRDVIGTYLHKHSEGRTEAGNSGPVHIVSVKIRDEEGESTQF